MKLIVRLIEELIATRRQLTALAEDLARDRERIEALEDRLARARRCDTQRSQRAHVRNQALHDLIVCERLATDTSNDWRRVHVRFCSIHPDLVSKRATVDPDAPVAGIRNAIFQPQELRMYYRRWLRGQDSMREVQELREIPPPEAA